MKTINTKSYSGIDYFRIIAAFLVVAIHTSPLNAFNKTGNFIFTRIIARTAVAFFFMTSGFFLVSKYSENNEKLIAFIKKTAAIYGAAILIYIPINIYSGYFKMDYIFPNIIKDIIFDGTFYHLWYLPASIAGGMIAWHLVKKFHYGKAFFIASALYLIGLFGDSYYGIALKIPCIYNFYNLIFQVSYYTRNGIFFAPVFFVIGGYIADASKRPSPQKSTGGFVICFTLMTLEAIVLHIYNLPRHDSMYILLLPAMYFLFNMLLHIKGKRHKNLRTISLIIYIIHPFMIVVTRMAAKLLNLQYLLIENSIIHYFIVCLTSAVLGVVITVLLNKLTPKKHNTNTDRAYLEINLNNLEHNINVLRNELPPKCELMAVVKAEAYGHGMYEITTHLNRIGVSAFAVATIDEAIRLRKYGICGEILILGYTSPFRAKELYKYNLTQNLIDNRYALLLNKQGFNIKAHIKIDTGMHRLGFAVEDTKKILAAFSMEHLKITGIFTHLCSADSNLENDIAFTNRQIDSFYVLLYHLKKSGLNIPKIHIQSSYGLLNYPYLECDYVRTGIIMYGVLSSPYDKTKLKPDLKPVLSLKARVILLRSINKGESVGYGRAFIAARNSKIAILPIGYADGLPRSLSCKNSFVLIGKTKAPIIGKICMDQVAVDVTDIPDVKAGMTATLIGQDGDEEITAPMLAEDAESITNELLSRMGQRLNVICKL